MELKCAIRECSNNHKYLLKFNHQPYRTAFWNDGTIQTVFCVSTGLRISEHYVKISAHRNFRSLKFWVTVTVSYFLLLLLSCYVVALGHAIAQLVEVLSYKS
jgi:hypothetical protein